ncbi:MAG: S-adenosylmethionine:tRNA ribosyltransferase-isomerase [Actinomycetota bacterium]|nr:S-adenosylmethionine:tRNA ribosyltransferase-isomerase [Actinomycetota bacterium]
MCLECSPSLSFDLPDTLVASVPPEARGVPRDGIRMLVASAAEGLRHAHAHDLPETLRAGDLLVLNTSETLPAALAGWMADGEPVAVHLSTVLPCGDRTPAGALAARTAPWVVELRRPLPGGSTPSYADRTGAVVALAGGGMLRVLGSHPAGATRSRLWVAELTTPAPLGAWLAEHGEPISYSHVAGRWPLTAYRTSYGVVPGSAEMPSAGRSLTPALLDRLRLRGVEVQTLVLHCGVSSLEGGDPPYAEWYTVPAATANAVTRAREDGRRVIAVGTTVVRALESAVDGSGVRPRSGWTDLVITPDRGVSVVDGLLTGWHEPAASHLWMLEAVAGRELLCDSYRSALANGYRWHEFGDVHLVLP